jgi:hypothetical protein
LLPTSSCGGYPGGGRDHAHGLGERLRAHRPTASAGPGPWLMRVATPADLIVHKLAAAAEPRRRASRGQPLNLEQVPACPVVVAGSLFGSDKA